MVDNLAVLVIGALIIAGGIFLYYRSTSRRKAMLGGFVLVGLAVMIGSQSFTIIPTGSTGVRTTFGQIDQVSMQPGFNVKLPFIQKVALVNNKMQDVSLATGGERIWAESKDKVQVYMADVTVTYQISGERSAWIHANVSNYQNNLVSHDLVASSLKNATKALTTYDVTTRSVIEPLAQENIQTAVDEKYGEGTIYIRQVVINDMNFETTYNEAVEQKNIAMQRQEQQAIENQTNIDKANAEAEAALIAAEGRAAATVAEAEGAAEANRLIAQSLTDEVLTKEYIDAIAQWRPYVIGEGAYPTLQLPNGVAQGATNQASDTEG